MKEQEDEAPDYLTRGRWCPAGEQWCDDVVCNSMQCRTAWKDYYEKRAAEALNEAFYSPTLKSASDEALKPGPTGRSHEGGEMSKWWKCPSGNLRDGYKCNCGDEHYRVDGVAMDYDEGGLMSVYEGPRLCPYDAYTPCDAPDVCHGNLINGHCMHDSDFKHKVDTTFFKTGDEAKLHWAAPAYLDTEEGVPYNIEPKGKGGIVDFHRRTEEEIWSSPYCAVNRGHCAIMDSDSGETCHVVGFCIWRLASETFNPWAVDLCMQNTDNVITEPAAGGSHSPHYHEDANRYKGTLPNKPEFGPNGESVYDTKYNSTPVMDGQNLEEIMGFTREQAYDDAIVKAIDEAQYILDVLRQQQDVPLASTIYHDTRNPKDIAGSTKPQYHLVPVTEGVARVMELGAKKYGPYNWREQKIAYTAYVSAAMRHMKAFLDREDLDPESKQMHIEHAAACMLILADAIYHGAAIDDRPHNPKVK